MRPSWVDKVNQADRSHEPPRTGRGATTDAWRTYATALGYPVPENAARNQIIGLVDAGPPPTQRRDLRTPKAEGPVFQATTRAVGAASHLTELDQPAIAVLLDLAKTIDGMDQRPSTAPLDNVTVPTFLRYAESLGLTPMARTRLDLKPSEGASKLTQLRAIRGGRAAG